MAEPLSSSTLSVAPIPVTSVRALPAPVDTAEKGAKIISVGAFKKVLAQCFCCPKPGIEDDPDAIPNTPYFRGLSGKERVNKFHQAGYSSKEETVRTLYNLACLLKKQMIEEMERHETSLSLPIYIDKLLRASIDHQESDNIDVDLFPLKRLKEVSIRVINTAPLKGC